MTSTTMIIVTTTLGELEAAAGRGLTGGGSILPMSDVIRLARHARHYLAIFDRGKALALYHTKRLASPAQRIVLYARDRVCFNNICRCCTGQIRLRWDGRPTIRATGPLLHRIVRRGSSARRL